MATQAIVKRGKSDINPYLLIWIKPRFTISEIARCNPYYGVVTVPMLFVSLSLINILIGSFYTHNFTVFILSLFGHLFGLFFYYLFIYFWVWLLKKIGNKMNGKADFEEVFPVVIWSQMPVILGEYLLIILVGLGLKLSVMLPHLSTFSRLIILRAPFSIWSLIILFKGLSAVQRFSMSRAIANFIVSFILGPVPALIILIFIDIMHMGF